MRLELLVGLELDLGLFSEVLSLNSLARECETALSSCSALSLCRICLVLLVSLTLLLTETETDAYLAINYYSPTLFGSLGIKDVALYTGIYGLVKGMLTRFLLIKLPLTVLQRLRPSSSTVHSLTCGDDETLPSSHPPCVQFVSGSSVHMSRLDTLLLLLPRARTFLLRQLLAVRLRQL